MAEPELARRRAGRVAVEGDRGRAPPRILPVAYVVIREALANAAERASGTNVTVGLSANEDELAEVGSRLRVESRHGRGTPVIAALPIHGVAS